MSYINRKDRIFLEGPRRQALRIRSQARLKHYLSNTDNRAWCGNVEDRRQHILEVAALNKEGYCSGKIPVDAILNVLSGLSDDQIDAYKKKLQDTEGKLLKYKEQELTAEQQELIDDQNKQIDDALKDNGGSATDLSDFVPEDADKTDDVKKKAKKDRPINIQAVASKSTKFTAPVKSAASKLTEKPPTRKDQKLNENEKPSSTDGEKSDDESFSEEKPLTRKGQKPHENEKPSSKDEEKPDDEAFSKQKSPARKGQKPGENEKPSSKDGVKPDYEAFSKETLPTRKDKSQENEKPSSKDGKKADDEAFSKEKPPTRKGQKPLETEKPSSKDGEKPDDEAFSKGKSPARKGQKPHETEKTSSKDGEKLDDEASSKEKTSARKGQKPHETEKPSSKHGEKPDDEAFSKEKSPARKGQKPHETEKLSSKDGEKPDDEAFSKGKSPARKDQKPHETEKPSSKDGEKPDDEAFSKEKSPARKDQKPHETEKPSSKDGEKPDDEAFSKEKSPARKGQKPHETEKSSSKDGEKPDDEAFSKEKSPARKGQKPHEIEKPSSKDGEKPDDEAFSKEKSPTRKDQKPHEYEKPSSKDEEKPDDKAFSKEKPSTRKDQKLLEKEKPSSKDGEKPSDEAFSKGESPARKGQKPHEIEKPSSKDGEKPDEAFSKDKLPTRKDQKLHEIEKPSSKGEEKPDDKAFSKEKPSTRKDEKLHEKEKPSSKDDKKPDGETFSREKSPTRESQKPHETEKPPSKDGKKPDDEAFSKEKLSPLSKEPAKGIHEERPSNLKDRPIEEEPLIEKIKKTDKKVPSKVNEEQAQELPLKRAEEPDGDQRVEESKDLSSKIRKQVDKEADKYFRSKDIKDPVKEDLYKDVPSMVNEKQVKELPSKTTKDKDTVSVSPDMLPSVMTEELGKEFPLKQLDKDKSAEVDKDLLSKVGKDLDQDFPSKIGKDLDKDFPSKIGKDLDKDISSKIGKDLDKDFPSKIGKDLDKDFPSKIGKDLDKDISSKIGKDLDKDFPSKIGKDLDKDFPSKIGKDLDKDFPSKIGKDLDKDFPSKIGKDLDKDFPSKISEKPETEEPSKIEYSKVDEKIDKDMPLQVSKESEKELPTKFGEGSLKEPYLKPTKKDEISVETDELLKLSEETSRDVPLKISEGLEKHVPPIVSQEDNVELLKVAEEPDILSKVSKGSKQDDVVSKDLKKDAPSQEPKEQKAVLSQEPEEQMAAASQELEKQKADESQKIIEKLDKEKAPTEKVKLDEPSRLEYPLLSDTEIPSKLADEIIKSSLVPSKIDDGEKKIGYKEEYLKKGKKIQDFLIDKDGNFICLKECSKPCSSKYRHTENEVEKIPPAPTKKHVKNEKPKETVKSPGVRDARTCKASCSPNYNKNQNIQLIGLDSEEQSRDKINKQKNAIKDSASSQKKKIKISNLIQEEGKDEMSTSKVNAIENLPESYNDEKKGNLEEEEIKPTLQIKYLSEKPLTIVPRGYYVPPGAKINRKCPCKSNSDEIDDGDGIAVNYDKLDEEKVKIEELFSAADRLESDQSSVDLSVFDIKTEETNLNNDECECMKLVKYLESKKSEDINSDEYVEAKSNLDATSNSYVDAQSEMETNLTNDGYSQTDPEKNITPPQENIPQKIDAKNSCTAHCASTSVQCTTGNKSVKTATVSSADEATDLMVVPCAEIATQENSRSIKEISVSTCTISNKICRNVGTSYIPTLNVDASIGNELKDNVGTNSIPIINVDVGIGNELKTSKSTCMKVCSPETCPKVKNDKTASKSTYMSNNIRKSGSNKQMKQAAITCLGCKPFSCEPACKIVSTFSSPTNTSTDEEPKVTKSTCMFICKPTTCPHLQSAVNPKQKNEAVGTNPNLQLVRTSDKETCNDNRVSKTTSYHDFNNGKKSVGVLVNSQACHYKKVASKRNQKKIVFCTNSTCQLKGGNKKDSSSSSSNENARPNLSCNKRSPGTCDKSTGRDCVQKTNDKDQSTKHKHKACENVGSMEQILCQNQEIRRLKLKLKNQKAYNIGQHKAATTAVQQLEYLQSVVEERDSLKNKLENSINELNLLKKCMTNGKFDSKFICTNPVSVYMMTSCSKASTAEDIEIKCLEREIENMKAKEMTPDLEAQVIRKELLVLKKYCSKLSIIQQENYKLKTELKGVKSKMTNFSEVLQDIGMDLNDDCNLLKNKLTTLRKTTQERDALKVKVVELEKELHSYRHVPEDIELLKKRSSLLDEVIQDRDRLSRRVEELRTKEEENKVLRKNSLNVGELERQLSRQQESLEYANNEIDLYRCQYFEAENELQQYKAEADSLKSQISCMEHEIESLKCVCKDAEQFREREEQQKEAVQQIYNLQIEHDNIRNQLKCFQVVKAERDLYKAKYDEISNLENECSALRSKVSKAESIEKEYESLGNQVELLENSVTQQECEIKKLVQHIDVLAKGRDEQQRKMHNTLCVMRAELEKKDLIIRTSDGKIAAIQEELRNSIKGVSSKTDSLRNRNKYLEVELQKLQNYQVHINQQLCEKQEELNNIQSVCNCLNVVEEFQCIQNQLTDYQEANLKLDKDLEEKELELCELRADNDAYKIINDDLNITNKQLTKNLEDIRTENKKLKEIAESANTISGDNHFNEMIRNSKCALQRIVEELRKQYNEWDDMKQKMEQNKSRESFTSNESEDFASGDSSSRIGLCTCQDNYNKEDDYDEICLCTEDGTIPKDDSKILLEDQTNASEMYSLEKYQQLLQELEDAYTLIASLKQELSANEQLSAENDALRRHSAEVQDLAKMSIEELIELLKQTKEKNSSLEREIHELKKQLDVLSGTSEGICAAMQSNENGSDKICSALSNVSSDENITNFKSEECESIQNKEGRQKDEKLSETDEECICDICECQDEDDDISNTIKDLKQLLRKERQEHELCKKRVAELEELLAKGDAPAAIIPEDFENDLKEKQELSKLISKMDDQLNNVHEVPELPGPCETLDDMINELTKQLEEQTKRADMAEESRRNMKVSDPSNMLQEEIERLKRELEGVKDGDEKKIKDDFLQTENDRLKKRIADLENELSKLKSDIGDTLTTTKGGLAEAGKLQDELAELRQKLAKCEAENNNLKKQLSSSPLRKSDEIVNGSLPEIQNFQTELNDLRKKLGKCEAENVDLKKQLGLSKLRKDGGVAEPDNLSDLEKLQNELDNLNQKLAKCEAENGILKKQLNIDNVGKESPGIDMESLLSELSDLKQKLAKCETENNKLRTGFGIDKPGKDGDAGEFVKLQNELDELKKKLAQCENEKNNMQKDRDSSKPGKDDDGELEQLKKKLAQCEVENNKLNKDLQDKEELKKKLAQSEADNNNLKKELLDKKPGKDGKDDGKQLEDLKKKLAQCEAENNNLKKDLVDKKPGKDDDGQLEELKKKLAQCETENNKLKNDLLDKKPGKDGKGDDKQLEELKKKLAQCEAENNKLKNDLPDKKPGKDGKGDDKQLEELKKKLAQCEAENNNLKKDVLDKKPGKDGKGDDKQLEELKNKLAQCEAENNNLKKDLLNKKPGKDDDGQLDELKKKLAQSEAENNNFKKGLLDKKPKEDDQGQLEELKKKLAQCETEKNNLQKDINNRKPDKDDGSHLDDLKKKLAQCEEEKNNLKNDLIKKKPGKDDDGQLEELKKKLAQCEIDKTNLKKELDANKKAGKGDEDDLKQKLAKLEAENNNLKKNLGSDKSPMTDGHKLQELEKKLAECEQENNNLKKALNEQKPKKDDDELNEAESKSTKLKEKNEEIKRDSNIRGKGDNAELEALRQKLAKCEADNNILKKDLENSKFGKDGDGDRKRLIDDYENKLKQLEAELNAQKKKCSDEITSLKNQFDKDMKNLINQSGEGNEKELNRLRDQLKKCEEERQKFLDNKKGGDKKDNGKNSDGIKTDDGLKDVDGDLEKSDQKGKGIGESIKPGICSCERGGRGDLTIQTFETTAIPDRTGGKCTCDRIFKEILDKILKSGCKSLGMKELELVHSRISDAASILGRDKTLAHSRLPSLKKLKQLEGNLFKEQSKAHQKVTELQMVVTLQKDKIEKMKQRLEKQRNEEINQMGDQHHMPKIKSADIAPYKVLLDKEKEITRQLAAALDAEKQRTDHLRNLLGQEKNLLQTRRQPEYHKHPHYGRTIINQDASPLDELRGRGCAQSWRSNSPPTRNPSHGTQHRQKHENVPQAYSEYRAPKFKRDGLD